jgi:DNA-binding NtrC family response regulator
VGHPAILVIERSVALSTVLSGLLSRNGFRVTRAVDQIGIRRLFEKWRPEIVLLGPSTIDNGCRVDCAREVRSVVGSIPIVLIADVSSEQLAINALRAGVNEYVKTASAHDEVILSIRRCLSSRPATLDSEGWQLRDGPGQRECSSRMVGDSAAMQEVRSRLQRVASTDSNVLITGETGTGKELIAEMLFRNSRRREKPFITINCAAIPDSLFESELFGYERGAFTGAHQSKGGKLKAADGGTVFLDEVGDMSAYGQSKMLRMIDSHEVQRLGRDLGVKVDVRILSATNHNLEKLIEENTFRSDLFFRLAVTSIELPPLRERKEDLPALLSYHIRYFNERLGTSVQRFSDHAMECLQAYDWPGNIRELKNLVEAIFVELPSENAEIAELPKPFRDRCLAMKSVSPSERQKLFSALLSTNWNKSKAASALQWSRMKLYRKIAQYKIERA